jgi:hypothetical protein
MRANKRKSVDAAALTSAWQKVFSNMAADDLDAYLAQGWMAAECVATKTGISIDAARARLKRMGKAGQLEAKKIRVLIEGKLRQIYIYRPQS